MHSAQAAPWPDGLALIPATQPLVSQEVRPIARPLTAPVLQVINGEHYAGAERVQDLLAGGLPELGFPVGFACLKPDRFPEVRQCRAAPLYRLPMAARFDLRTVGQLVQIIRREGYQLLHAHTPRSALVARLAAQWAGVPMIYHVHSPSWHDSTRRWQDRCNWLLERCCLGGAVHLIAVSHYLAEEMAARGFDRTRISVVHNGVPRAEPAPDRTAPAGRWTLGAVALWRPRKGLEVLLEALALLAAERQPVGLHVVGPFETAAYEADVRRRASALGLDEHLEWRGFRADVLAELSALDLFVLPSLFGEGLPMVLLEAMAAGVPVVAARVAGIDEAVRDGQEGVLARPGDPQDLARAIRAVLSGQHDWAQLRRQAIARQTTTFSAESMTAGVAAVYRTVLAHGA
jgi:glycosyltransferase involved in cell wall biosynthesis